MRSFPNVVLLAAAFFALHPPAESEAQLRRVQPSDDPVVALQVTKAFIDTGGFGDGFSWYTSVIRGRLVTPIGESTAFVADWGVSLAGVGSESDATLANPELGITFIDDDGASSGFVSVILPLAKTIGEEGGFGFGGSTATAILSDPIWLERFAPDLLSLNAGITPSSAIGDGDATRLNYELTGSFLMPTEDGGENEFFARYGFGISHALESVRLRADVNGIAVLSEGDLDFGERTIHELFLGIEGVDGGPGFFVKVPLDENFDSVDAVIGATLVF